MSPRRGSDAAYLPVRYARVALADLTEAHLVGTLAATVDDVVPLDDGTVLVPFAGTKPRGLYGCTLVDPAAERRDDPEASP